MPCLDVIMIAFFPEKCTVKDHISNTKLEKGDHYYIQTRHKYLFYRYGGHIELIRFKKYYRVPRGHERISFVFSSAFRDIVS